MNSSNPSSKLPAWGPLGAAIVAVGIAGWAVYDTRETAESLKDALSTRLGEQAAQQKAASQSIDTLTRELKDAQGRVRDMESKLAEYAGQRVALEEMARELARAPDDWLLAEIEQTLNIASRELTLASNVRAALSALQGADQRLARADKPQMAALRRAIAQDMRMLASRSPPRTRCSWPATLINPARPAGRRLPPRRPARLRTRRCDRVADDPGLRRQPILQHPRQPLAATARRSALRRLRARRPASDHG